MTTQLSKSAQAYRKAIMGANVEQDIRPVPTELILEHVLPEYQDIAKAALASGEPAVVKCQMSPEILKALIAANGANRQRTISHVEGLASDFRGQTDENGNRVPDTGYIPSMTKVVLSEGQIVVDGGHSTMAMMLAFYPLYHLDGIYTEDVEIPRSDLDEDEFDKDNEEHYETVTRTVYPAVSDKFPLNVALDNEKNRMLPTEEEPEFGVEEAEELAQEHRNRYAESDLVFDLDLNAPASVCKKLASRRLNMTIATYIEMVPQLRHWAENTLGLDMKTVGEVTKGWYLRTNSKYDSEGNIVYGRLDAGGRPSNEEAPVWLLAFAERLENAYNLLKAGTDTVAFYKKADGIGLKNVLVAMVCSDDAGMEKIAKGLTGNATKSPALANEIEKHLSKPADHTGPWNKSPAKLLVAILVAFGRGKSAKDACQMSTDDDTYQTDAKYRGHGWDSGDANECEDGNEDRSDVLVSMSPLVDEASLAGETTAKSIKSKAQAGKRGKAKSRRKSA